MFPCPLDAVRMNLPDEGTDKEGDEKISPQGPSILLRTDGHRHITEKAGQMNDMHRQLVKAAWEIK